MGIGCVAQLIDRVDHGRQRRVESDRKIGARDVVIDGARDADAVDAHLGQRQRAAVRAISPDHDDRLDAAFLQLGDSLCADFRILEFRQAGRSQNGAAAVDDLTDAGLGQRLDIAFHHSLVSIINSEYFDAAVQSDACDGTDSCIHPRRVSAGS